MATRVQIQARSWMWARFLCCITPSIGEMRRAEMERKCKYEGMRDFAFLHCWPSLTVHAHDYSSSVCLCTTVCACVCARKALGGDVTLSGEKTALLCKVMVWNPPCGLHSLWRCIIIIHYHALRSSTSSHPLCLSLSGWCEGQIILDRSSNILYRVWV